MVHMNWYTWQGTQGMVHMTWHTWHGIYYMVEMTWYKVINPDMTSSVPCRASHDTACCLTSPHYSVWTVQTSNLHLELLARCWHGCLENKKLLWKISLNISIFDFFSELKISLLSQSRKFRKLHIMNIKLNHLWTPLRVDCSFRVHWFQNWNVWVPGPGELRTTVHQCFLVCQTAGILSLCLHTEHLCASMHSLNRSRKKISGKMHR